MKYFLLTLMLLIIACSKNNKETNSQNTITPNDSAITNSNINNSDQTETKETSVYEEKSFEDWFSNNFDFDLPRIKVKEYVSRDDSNYYYFLLHLDTIWVSKDLNKDNVKDLLVTGFENSGGSGCWVHLYSIINK